MDVVSHFLLAVHEDLMAVSVQMVLELCLLLLLFSEALDVNLQYFEARNFDDIFDDH